MGLVKFIIPPVIKLVVTSNVMVVMAKDGLRYRRG